MDIKCSLCGHYSEKHWYETGKVICRACPNGLCQDGPAGKEYRAMRRGKIEAPAQ